jgi:hypothetical protein
LALQNNLQSLKHEGLLPARGLGALNTIVEEEEKQREELDNKLTVYEAAHRKQQQNMFNVMI